MHRDTAAKHSAHLVAGNIVRRRHRAIALERDQSMWNMNAWWQAHESWESSRHPSGSPQEVALAEHWTAQALRRLEAQIRGAEFLPAERLMEAEAEALRTRLAFTILMQAPHTLYPVRGQLPFTKFPEQRFPDFYDLKKKDSPTLPEVGPLVDWLREIQAILRASAAPRADHQFNQSRR